MSVTVRLFAAAAEAVGANQVTVEASDVAGLREVLGTASDTAAPVIRQCAVLDGGVRRDDAYVLSDGATVDVMPPFAGG